LLGADLALVVDDPMILDGLDPRLHRRLHRHGAPVAVTAASSGLTRPV
jgi:hypothetical protein